MNNLAEEQRLMRARWSWKKHKGPKVGTKQVRRRLTPNERQDIIFQARLAASQVLHNRGWTFEQIAPVVKLPVHEVEHWLSPPTEEELSSLRAAASEL